MFYHTKGIIKHAPKIFTYPPSFSFHVVILGSKEFIFFLVDCCSISKMSGFIVSCIKVLQLIVPNRIVPMHYLES